MSLLSIAQALSYYGEQDSHERRETAWLLETILGQKLSLLKFEQDRLLTEEQQQQFLMGIERLKTGEPLAYILGEQPFWTLNLKVTPATLIPRPDTEIIIEQTLALSNLAGDAKILDMGTGSGAIALSLASEKPLWRVTATDFSQAALTVAQENAVLNKISNVSFYQGSWYKALPDGMVFDVIVSNPPYIDPDDIHLKDLTHEPITALTAENHGLADLQIIVSQAPEHLKSHGWLLVEHGYDQGQVVRDLFEQAGFEQVVTIKDYGGNDRVTLGHRLSI